MLETIFSAITFVLLMGNMGLVIYQQSKGRDWNYHAFWVLVILLAYIADSMGGLL